LDPEYRAGSSTLWRATEKGKVQHGFACLQEVLGHTEERRGVGGPMEAHG